MKMTSPTTQRDTFVATKPPDPEHNSSRFLRNVLLKALGFFLLFNLAFALWYPLPELGRISAYNHLFPGRMRLPYSDKPNKSYSLSLYNLEAMFASHEIAAGAKPANEYRVITIGDSSTWGFLLPPDQTLAAFINREKIQLPDGRTLRAYNLGYPIMSLMKDLLMLTYALRYQPDLILWPVTLESFPYDKQLSSPLLQNNPEPVLDLISTYGLRLEAGQSVLVRRSLYDRTIPGRRRELADLLRLQIYGVMWAATGIDQDIPTVYTSREQDLSNELSFHGLQPPHLNESDLALDILAGGMKAAGQTPVLLINEPMFISQGKNSDIRYNFYYPRWAYDDYRQLMRQVSSRMSWHYLDAWDLVPPSEFTNTAVHMTPAGEQIFARRVAQAILDFLVSSKQQ
jgi:hypothetical protein